MKCNACNQIKPDECFSASKPTRCKSCVSAHDKLYCARKNLAGPAKPRSPAMPLEKKRILRSEQNLKWRNLFPERNIAHKAVYKALKSGMINRLPCLVCGAKSEAHHPDYTRPLDVVWLCRPHHKDAHKLI